jgi:hypothetical protein
LPEARLSRQSRRVVIDMRQHRLCSSRSHTIIRSLLATRQACADVSSREQLQLGATLVLRLERGGGDEIQEGLHAGGRHQPLASTDQMTILI